MRSRTTSMLATAQAAVTLAGALSACAPLVLGGAPGTEVIFDGSAGVAGVALMAWALGPLLADPAFRPIIERKLGRKEQ